MATIVAVRSGNWSDTSHVTGPWPGASTPTTKPGVGDTVDCGIYIVEIDEDVHVARLVRNSLQGKFYMSNLPEYPPREITADFEPSQGPLLEVAEIEERFFNVTGNVSGGSGNGAIGIYSPMVPIGTLIGDVTGGSGAGAVGVQAGIGTMIGNVTGGSGAGAVGVRGLIADTITGNVTAGSGDVAYGIDAFFSITVVNGTLTWLNGLAPIKNGFRQVADPANAIVVTTPSGDPWTLSNDYPAPADVRSGVEYDRGTQVGEMAAGGSIGPVSIVIGGGGIRIF